MGQIQSSVGLVTGVPIQDTVDKLMSLNSLPRNRLANRTKTLSAEQAAVTTLTSLVIGVQLTTDRLGQASLYSATSVSSTKTDLLSATSSGSPAVGSYSFIPVRQAQSQQLTSSLFASADQTLATGKLTIQAGGFLDNSLSLDQLNGGTGVARGFIRITDRSGAARDIDLRFAQSAADVVSAINATDGVSVVAKLEGDHFELTDVSGSSSQELKVEEVGTGTTARDLGFEAVAATNGVIESKSLTGMTRGTLLRGLRDGMGLEMPKIGYLLRFNLADESQVSYNTQLDSNSSNLGQLLDEINSAGEGKVTAAISSDGKSIEFKDLTSGSAEFSVTSPDGNLATQLGVTGTATAGTIKGGPLVAGLSDTLLSSLNGGQGLGQLGEIKITDKEGDSAKIDLSDVKTLGEVIDKLNAESGLAGYRVQLNRNKTGIEIIDTSSGSGSLKIENADSTNTATVLQLEGESSSGSVDSGSLHRQYVGVNTSIADFLGGGQALSQSSFRITDSAGKSANFNVVARNPKNIGDVITAINGMGIGVEAKINEQGDGILLVDTAGGTGTLTVADTGTGKAAQQLRIAGTASSQEIDGETKSAIDGTKTIELTTTATTKLSDLVSQINGLTGRGIRANLVNLGNSGVRIQLSGQSTGAQARFAISSDIGVEFAQTSEARDALVSFGANEFGGGVLASSSSNDFGSLVDGLKITVNATSTTPVTVSVTQSSATLTKQVQTFVDQYNTLRGKLSELTAFDAATNNIGTLFGSGEALRLEQAFSRLFTTTIRGGSGGAIRSLPELGVKLDQAGKLSLDTQQLQKAIDNNPEAVKDFFTNETNGFSVKAKAVADSLAGVEGGSLLEKNKSLQTTIEQNNARLAKLDDSLAKQRTRLLNQFYAMETAISKIQSNLTSVGQIQNLFTNSNR
jgi:flagellar hook-associated protein 2